MSEYDRAVKLLDEAAEHVNEINNELMLLRMELRDVTGTPCEVCQRIVGYYRNVKNWNPGKQSEYEERNCFAPNWMKPDA